MSITIKLNDYSKEVLDAVERAKKRGLEACGSNAETYAKDECPVDTGNLRNSITYQLDGDNAVQIGTDVDYAMFVELGTGHYSLLGGGTQKDSWVYMAEDGSFHVAHPMQPRQFIKPAVADHGDEFENLIKDSFRNA